MDYPCLQINIDKIMELYATRLTNVALECLGSIEALTKSRLNAYGQKKADQEMTILQTVYNEIDMEISAKLMSVGRVLLDSYGTGNNLNTGGHLSSSDIAKYKNSDLWNKSRKSNTIVGRPKTENGKTYIDFFGEHQTSSGSMDGKALNIPEIMGSQALPLAEKDIFSKVLELLDEEMEEINKYINDNLEEFFDYF